MADPARARRLAKRINTIVASAIEFEIKDPGLEGVTIVDAKGRTVARLGGEAGPGLEAGRFIAPHGLAVDSRGDIYVGEVSYTEFPKAFPDVKIPWRMRSLQKLEKVNEAPHA